MSEYTPAETLPFGACDILGLHTMSMHDGALLFIHGWGSWAGAARKYIEGLQDSYTGYALDMRGHGETPGELEQLSRQDFLDDILCAYDCIADRHRHITVIGSSFGGYMSAVLTAHRPVDRLVLRAPANYANRGFDEPHHPQSAYWRVWREAESVNDNMALQALGAFTGPMLLVEAGRDDVIPHSMIQEYQSAITSPDYTYELMPNCPHSMSTHPPSAEEYLQVLRRWLQSS